MIYEGYGPSGIAIYMEVITDNKNRTVSELRHILNKNDGSLAEPGSVSWIFKRIGMITVTLTNFDEEKLLYDILECGADDFEVVENDVFISTDQNQLMAVKDGLDSLHYIVKSSDLIMTPNSYQYVNSDNQDKVLKLIDTIDSHDDVNQVFSNFSFDKGN